MKPIEFPEANTVLNKPDEMTDEECMPLPVCVCRDSEDLPLIISCWEPTPEEWDALRKQGHIYIAIVSEEYHPPLIVFPGNPFDADSEPTPVDVVAYQPPHQSTRQPIQPIILDEHGVRHFKANRIIEYLLRCNKFNMNELAMLNFDNDERQHFAQLIGYSVCGYTDLSYHNESVALYAETTQPINSDKPTHE